jgi:hypothetical protein
MLRFRIAALASVLVIGAGTVGAGLTAASAATVAHVQYKPTKGEQSLGSHVPSSYVDTCSFATAETKKTYAAYFSDPRVKKLTNSIVAAIMCNLTGASVPETVYFTQWKNVADMNGFYHANLDGYNIAPNLGAVGQTTCPQEGTVVVGGTTDGRYVCQPSISKQPKQSAQPAAVVWTTNSLKIMGEAQLTTDTDGAVLYRWWTNGNPGPLK